MVSFPKWALGWGKEVVFTQKASRQCEAASDMDISDILLHDQWTCSISPPSVTVPPRHH